MFEKLTYKARKICIMYSKRFAVTFITFRILHRPTIFLVPPSFYVDCSAIGHSPIWYSWKLVFFRKNFLALILNKKNTLVQWHSEKKKSVSNSIIQNSLIGVFETSKSKTFSSGSLRSPDSFIKFICQRVMLKFTLFFCFFIDIIIILSIHYILILQLEWLIIMYKVFCIISEWCSLRLVISIWVWSWLENLNSVKADLSSYKPPPYLF